MEQTVWFENGAVCLVDQTLLPHEHRVVRCVTCEEVAYAIRSMQVRGAPAIGVAAAYGIALAAHGAERGGAGRAATAVREAGELLAAARPTAVNLGWAVRRMMGAMARLAESGDPAGGLLREAEALAAADRAANEEIGRLGASMIAPGERILTYCHTGGLATAGFGTAFGMLRAAHEAGKGISVVACETRPVLQGARLTAWELMHYGIPSTLITDNAAGALMAQGLIDRVVLGADRIAANGDVANKVGTYTLAVLARAHGLPFVVAAPTSTVDLATPDGGSIPIEERDASEVTQIAGRRIAPDGVTARNPAFDVTPGRLVDAIVTEAGIARAPYADSLRELAGEGGRA